MKETFEAANPGYPAAVRAIFSEAPFIRELGIELVDVGPGWCESRIELGPRHLQQDGFVHAGVIGSMSDHTSGAAGGSLIPIDRRVLTVEYKLNLLRPGTGDTLHCRAEVIRNGQRIIVAESEVFARQKGTAKLIAKAIVTLAVV
jgi:uncharacterized protein (TIGR00369 family)